MEGMEGCVSVKGGRMEATSHYVSAVHRGNWSVCDSYCQNGEGRGDGEEKARERGRDREGQREKERGGGRGREGRKRGVWYFLVLPFFFPSLHPP